MDEDDDPYGIKEQLAKYVGIRNGPRKKAQEFAKAKDIKVQTFMVMRAAEGEEDAFRIPGSNIPLWLAFVNGLTVVQDKANVHLTWFVPLARTAKVDGYFPADKTFCKISGDETITVENAQLVLINIPKLNGGKRTEGKIPARSLKDLSRVLLPSELDKKLACCPMCSQRPQKGDTVECVECGQSFHVVCVGSGISDPSRWLCSNCELEEECE